MKFAPLQGEFAKAVVPRYPQLAGVDSLVLVERRAGGGERVLVRSEAALRIATYLGGTWGLARVFRLVPRGVRDWAYDRVARSRFHLFGKYDAPPPPVAARRERFLP